MKKNLLFVCMLFFAFSVMAQPLKRVKPEKIGIDSRQLKYADEAILQAIANKEIPGAVLAVVRNNKMAYLKAYGDKEVYPQKIKMDVQTVFDMASVSKCMSTTICTMILIERGKIRLQDKVSLYIPGFSGWKDDKNNENDIRIVDLLTHTSGLPSYAPVSTLKEQHGSPSPDGLIQYIATCKRQSPPNTTFVYSCLNFITLQRIIEIVSGQSLRDFAKENIFDVLGMTHTDYNPTGEMLSLCAPTEKQPDGSVLTGVVHDPLARVMNGGISGNAGVFSTADDVAILSAALLNGGEYNGKRILGTMTVMAMASIPRGKEAFGRALGWDIHSTYSSVMGDLFGPHTYGHTGYTGTSLILDPDTHTAVILLTNRVHPDDTGNVTRLRSFIANIIAGSVVIK